MASHSLSRAAPCLTLLRLLIFPGLVVREPGRRLVRGGKRFGTETLVAWHWCSRGLGGWLMRSPSESSPLGTPLPRLCQLLGLLRPIRLFWGHVAPLDSSLAQDLLSAGALPSRPHLAQKEPAALCPGLFAPAAGTALGARRLGWRGLLLCSAQPPALGLRQMSLASPFSLSLAGTQPNLQRTQVKVSGQPPGRQLLSSDTKGRAPPATPSLTEAG